MMIKPLSLREIPYKDIDLEDIYRTYSGETAGFILGSGQLAALSRYSYVSIGPPKELFYFNGRTVTLVSEKGVRRKFKTNDFLSDLARWVPRRKRPARQALPPFLGGVVGYFSYSAGRFFDSIILKDRNSLNVPDAYFGIYENLVAVDHFRQKAWLIGDAGYPQHRKSDQVENFMSGCWQISPGRKAFSRMVRRAQKSIAAGEIYQANLSLRVSAKMCGDPVSYYENLSQINPSPFSCYLQFMEPSLKIASCSPELLLRKRGRFLETRPIAGTRPRGRTLEEDDVLRGQLLLSDKERAEHLMLVDLERNDLGRVCRPGSVRVKESFVVEKYSHVMHIVSHITGELRSGLKWTDALRASFPGGTISGCPKIRAMKIIDELESASRGPFFGSAGWIGYNGDMDLNILIRTAVMMKGRIHVQAGAGIVADSIPDREYDESLQKAKALLLALGGSRGKAKKEGGHSSAQHRIGKGTHLGPPSAPPSASLAKGGRLANSVGGPAPGLSRYVPSFNREEA